MDAVLSCDREKSSLILFNKLYAVRDDSFCYLLLRIIYRSEILICAVAPVLVSFQYILILFCRSPDDCAIAHCSVIAFYSFYMTHIGKKSTLKSNEPFS